MRTQLTAEFTALADTEGTFQNTSRHAVIEIATSTTKNTGIVLRAGETRSIKSDDTLYARVAEVSDNTETVYLAHEPFKLQAGGGDASVMTGATADADGKAGLVPKPLAGDNVKVLAGDGSFVSVGYKRRARKAFTLADLEAAVADGYYAARDIDVGDYYVGASGYTYIFAGHNPLRGTYTGYPIAADHAGLIVQTHATSKWNPNNDTTGGYVSSALHSYLVDTVLPKVKTDLGGVSHLYAHKKLYSNAITATRYNKFGTNTGASSNWAWSDDQYIAALSEMQVYGGTVWSSSGYDTGEADQQLEVFRRFKHTEIFGDEYPWLRDVASATYACYASTDGYANYHSASDAYYVAGLIAFH